MGKTNHYNSQYFSLQIHQKKSDVQLTMKIHSPLINTRQLPDTYYFLKTHFPQVLTTQCFNEENNSFDEEVKKTEIGHLFEHIILEKLCTLKIEKGHTQAVHEGRTSWDWITEHEGTFHICIDSAENEQNFLEQSIEYAISLLEKLFSEQRLSGQPAQLPA